MLTKIEELKAQIAQMQSLKAKQEQIIAEEEQKGAEADQGKIQRAQEEWDGIDQDEKRHNGQLAEEQAKQYETRVDQTRGEIAALLDDLTYDGRPIRSFFASEEEYQATNIAYKQAFLAEILPRLERERELETKLSGAQEREIQWERQNENLQRKNSELTAALETSKTSESQAIKDAADYQQKRDAAAAEIEDWKELYRIRGEEIERLKEATDEKTRESYKVVDAKEEEELRDKLRIMKTVYNVVPNREINPTEFTATRAIDGVDVGYNWYQKGGYTVIDESEVSQFREQNAKYVPIKYELPAVSNITLDNGSHVPAAAQIEQFQAEAAAGSETFPGKEETSGISGGTSGATSETVASESGMDANQIEARFRRIEEQLGLKSWQYDAEVA